MRTTSVAATVLVGLGLGLTSTGCTEGAAEKEPSAQQLLDSANDAMSELTSVTVETRSGGTGKTRATTSGRLTTDLRNRCRSRVTWPEGASLEQIRIDDTDYVRPNRKYLQNWSGRRVADSAGERWVRTPASAAEPGDGLTTCRREFASFGKATKGGTTRIDGTEARALVVTDEADDGGTYTFYVATEGKPHILKVAYKGGRERTTTTYSDFDAPLDVQAPDRTDVVDTGTGSN